MSEISLRILLWISSFLGVETYPLGATPWTIEQHWELQSNGVYKAQFSANIEDLGCKSTENLVFPSILHAAHEIKINDTLVTKFGDPTMATTRSFYGSPVIDCNVLTSGKINWTAYCPTKYFSRINAWPRIEKGISPIARDEIMWVAAAGALLVLGLYLVWLTNKTDLQKMTMTLAAFSISTSIFFAISACGLFGFSMQMLFAHKCADFFLNLAACLFIYYLFLRNLITLKVFRICTSALALVVVTIMSGENADVVQLGTSVGFLPAGVAFTFGLSSQILKYDRRHFQSWLQNTLGFGIFVISSLLDILYTLGIHNWGMTLPFGFVGCAYFLALATQSEIKSAYDERDYLRLNLEHEVEIKTSQLKKSEGDLRSALSIVQHTQAELIQSAKLASLGTLSAGIAHEINNSLNFVSGALPPLEKVVNNIADEKEKKRINSLMAAIKDGVSITLEIARSLRSYSGLNQAKLKDIAIKDTAHSVLTILKNRIKVNIRVIIEIPENQTIFSNHASLNQIFMNLITNSLDAMPAGGTLTIKSAIVGDFLNLEFTDTGSGIDPKIVANIFDPFFTTKDVGQGTGLGLSIVKNEVARLKGSIAVESTPNIGTKFTLKLPISITSEQERAS